MENRVALTIRTKLLLLSSLGLALVVALGVASTRGTARMGEAMGEIRTTGSALRNHLEGDMMHDALRSDVLASLLASREEHAQVRSDLAEHAAHFREMLGENEALALPPAVRAALDAAKPALDAYVAHAERIVARAAEDRDAARAEYSGFLESFETLEARMAELSDLVEQSADDAEQHGQQAQSAAQRTALAVCLFAVVALGAGALLVTRAIVMPLGQTVAVLERVADGDLTPRLAIGSRDEVARMAQSLNRTLDAWAPSWRASTRAPAS